MAHILLSAGGTGGHLFPAEALAAELINRGHRVTIITDKRGQAFKSLGESVAVHTVRAATLKSGIVQKIKAIFNMAMGIAEATLLIIKNKPDVVVGFGGYPSFPGVFAAQALYLPTIIHEQNAVLGKANIFLANRADMIALSFPGTRSIKPRNQKKTVVTGNPVRRAVVDIRTVPYKPSTDQFRILVTGGSQAASIFSDVLPAAIAALPEEMQKRISIAHQARDTDIPRTVEAYRKTQVAALIQPFFANIAELLRDCHLFIGRSGASTVSEIAVAGRPALFVPLRHADMQQKHNAEVVTNQGGGWMLMQEEFTPAAISEMLREWMQNPGILEKSALCAKNTGQPDAARILAETVENFLKDREK